MENGSFICVIVSCLHLISTTQSAWWQIMLWSVFITQISKRKTTIKISQAFVEMPGDSLVVSKFPHAHEGKVVSDLLGIVPIWKITWIAPICLSCHCVNCFRFHLWFWRRASHFVTLAMGSWTQIMIYVAGQVNLKQLSCCFLIWKPIYSCNSILFLLYMEMIQFLKSGWWLSCGFLKYEFLCLPVEVAIVISDHLS